MGGVLSFAMAPRGAATPSMREFDRGASAPATARRWRRGAAAVTARVDAREFGGVMVECRRDGVSGLADAARGGRSDARAPRDDKRRQTRSCAWIDALQPGPVPVGWAT